MFDSNIRIRNFLTICLLYVLHVLLWFGWLKIVFDFRSHFLKVTIIGSDASYHTCYWIPDEHQDKLLKKCIFKFSHLSLYWIYPAWNWLLAENKFCIYAGNGNEILTLYLKIKWFRNWFINFPWTVWRVDVNVCNEYKMFLDCPCSDINPNNSIEINKLKIFKITRWALCF